MKRIVHIAVFFFFAVLLHAQNPGQLELSIRYYDKAIYFPDSTVQVKLEFYNNTAAPARFKIAENHFFSLDFDVRSISNIPANRARSFVIARGTDSPVYFREVSLEPGERFGFVEVLNGYTDIPDVGVYTVRAIFYPELNRSGNSQTIFSNTLTLTVHPGATALPAGTTMDPDTGNPLERNALPPDEVVTYLLTARQHEKWNKFLLYLDLERLYTRENARADRYRRLSGEDRRRAIAVFRQELTQKTTEDDILLIPSTFRIVKTSYTNNEATVVVSERFSHSTFTEVKEYTYYLAREDRIWTVYDYAVRNLGTE